MTFTASPHPVLELLRGYRAQGRDETADVERVRALAADPGNPWSRSLPLHLTASALIVHPDSGQVLLRWHQRQQAWLQVGGHGDPGESDALMIAVREAREETGLVAGRFHPAGRHRSRASGRQRGGARARRPAVHLRHPNARRDQGRESRRSAAVAPAARGPRPDVRGQSAGAAGKSQTAPWPVTNRTRHSPGLAPIAPGVCRPDWPEGP